MALRDRIDAPRTVIHGYPCSIGALRQELPSDEAAALDRMLYELGWSARQVHEALTAEGYRVSWQQIGTHRRGQCRCLPAER